MTGKILRDYVSEIDQFIEKFNKDHASLSLSQKKEIQKYEKVYFLRDVADRSEMPKKLWEGF
jgi:hypothetical protein